MIARILSMAVYALSTAIGIVAFLYPFFLPSLEPASLMGRAHASDAPLVLTLIVGLSFLALLFEAQGETVSAKLLALLGVLVSLNAMLRFVEVAIPGPGGFSPIFFLIVMTGYVYGGRFGFQMGVLTLIVGALITGGVGPWMPYQMLVAGWVGLSAPLCRPLARVLRRWGERAEVAVLAVFGAFWGFVYGALMNIWFWPFMTGPAEQSWDAGSGLLEALGRYAVFYLVTSLGWDVFRAVGTMALILAFGGPTLRVLRRFRRRFDFCYEPAAV